MLQIVNAHNIDTINTLASSEHFKGKMQETDSDFTILQCQFIWP